MRNVARLMATMVALATGLTAWSCRGDSLPCGELTGTDVEEWHPRLRGDVEAALDHAGRPSRASPTASNGPATSESPTCR